MSVDMQADQPLTRTDVERLIQEGGSSERLNLHGRNLRGTDLSHLDLHGADLSATDLRGTDLTQANLQEVNLHQANLSNAKIIGAQLWGAYLKETQPEAGELLFRVEASGQGELVTKYWLMAKGRFADLIEYTQTHDSRFAEEAHTVIVSVTHRSPLNMDWKIDLSAPSIAEALVTTIDGIAQMRKRLEKAALENQARAQDARNAEQQAENAQQMALLEQEKQRLAIEQQRLEILEKRLEVQKKGIEYALEIARKVVDTLHPGADPAARAMEMQALLPNLLQLQNGKGLELALPSQSGREEPLCAKSEAKSMMKPDLGDLSLNTFGASRPLAVLIDGENMSYLHLGRILAEAERWGLVTVRQVYIKRPSWWNGQEGQNQPREAWYDAATCYDFEVRADVPALAGKNAVDIALTVGAMDLFHAGIRQFCLATSDHDFVALITRLQGAGCAVLGIGNATTSLLLREASLRFVPIEDLPAPVPWTRLWEVIKIAGPPKGWKSSASMLLRKRRKGSADEGLALTDMDITFLQREADSRQEEENGRIGEHDSFSAR